MKGREGREGEGKTDGEDGSKGAGETERTTTELVSRGEARTERENTGGGAKGRRADCWNRRNEHEVRGVRRGRRASSAESERGHGSGREEIRLQHRVDEVGGCVVSAHQPAHHRDERARKDRARAKACEASAARTVLCATRSRQTPIRSADRCCARPLGACATGRARAGPRHAVAMQRCESEDQIGVQGNKVCRAMRIE
eukprot:1223934-Pleurochrysis_carterae.AAC.2